MSTKYINGSYPQGYAIKPNITALSIGSSARIGVAGVSSARKSPVAITNLGAIAAEYGQEGIRLVGGGSVTNGGAGNAGGLISGYHGIEISGGVGKVVNLDGTIASATSATDNVYVRSVSVVLEAGGTVTNATAGVITSGVDIAGRTGVVANNGTIGGLYYFNDGPSARFLMRSGPAVVLNDGGKVTNGLASAVAQIDGGLQIAGRAGAVDNAGTITGSSVTENGVNIYQNISASVILSAGGSLTNQASGDLTDGVSISGIGAVTNLGQIGAPSRGGGADGTYRYRYDSVILNQGRVTNGSATDTTATIGNGLTGVSIESGAGRVLNFGTISGSDNDAAVDEDRFSPGIALLGGGVVTNGSNGDHSALISDSDCGVYVTGGTGRVTNFGAIDQLEPLEPDDDGHWGVLLAAGGTVVNGSRTDHSARIAGVVGVDLNGAGTLTNYGMIIGNSAGGGLADSAKPIDGAAITSSYVYAVQLHSASEKLIEEGSGVLIGAVAGDGGTLVLDSKGGSGELYGLGSTITGFASVIVSAGAYWELEGSNSFAATTALTNNGTLHVDQGDTLTIGGAIKGSGVIELGLDGQVTIQNSVASSASVAFTGVKAALTLDNPGSFQGALSGLDARGSDRLVLIGFGTGTAVSFQADSANTGGTLTVTDGAAQAQIDLLGQYVAAGFQEAVSASETVITYMAPPETAHLAPPV